MEEVTDKAGIRMHTIQIITLEEAQERLLAHVHPVMPEKVGLLESIDRILARMSMPLSASRLLNGLPWMAMPYGAVI